MDEPLREVIEDAVVRALEAGVPPGEVRAEVDYAIESFGELEESLE